MQRPQNPSIHHPSLETVRSIAGLLALAACLALLSPGVRAVRAEEPAAPLEVVVSTIDGEIEISPRERDLQAEADSGFVVLNTRGYNYGPERPTVRPALPAAPDGSAPSE